MVSMLASCAVDRGFDSLMDKKKDYKIDICKDWLAWNQDNVYEWCDMSVYMWTIISVS